MMSGRMQPEAIQKLLDTDGRPNASLDRPEENKWSDFCWVGICTETSWNTETAFFEACDTETCHNKDFSILEKQTLNTLKILKYTAFLFT
jgi:hypothetical protein